MTEREPRSSGRAWWAVAVLLLLYVLSFVDRQVINLMVDPLRAEFGIGDFGVSLLMGFGFAVFYTLFGIPIARLADTRSRRAIIAVGLAVWSAMTAACGLARTYGQLMLARMGVGVGEAALSPAAYSLIADSFPPRRMATAISVYSVGTYLGSGLAFVLAGHLIGILREPVHALPILGEVKSWQLVFLVVGLPGLLLLPLLATVNEPPRRDDAGAASLGATIAHVWSHRRAYLCHNLGFALLAFSGYGSAAWTPTFLQRSHGMTPAESGIATGWILAIAGTCGVVGGGLLSDALAARGLRDAKIRTGLIASIAWIPTGILYLLVGDRTWALALMIPTVLASSMPWGCAAAAIQEMTPPRMRAQASAIYLFVINLIGLGIGPSAIGYLTQYVYGDDRAVRWSMMWVTLAAHVLAAVLLWAGSKAFVRASRGQA